MDVYAGRAHHRIGHETAHYRIITSVKAAFAEQSNNTDNQLSGRRRMVFQKLMAAQSRKLENAMSAV